MAYFQLVSPRGKPAFFNHLPQRLLTRFHVIVKVGFQPGDRKGGNGIEFLFTSGRRFSSRTAEGIVLDGRGSAGRRERSSFG